LREIAKEQISKRSEEIKNDVNVRNDILALILKNEGFLFFLNQYFIIDFF
jgi:hypothetical protein